MHCISWTVILTVITWSVSAHQLLFLVDVHGVRSPHLPGLPVSYGDLPYVCTETMAPPGPLTCTESDCVAVKNDQLTFSSVIAGVTPCAAPVSAFYLDPGTGVCAPTTLLEKSVRDIYRLLSYEYRIYYIVAGITAHSVGSPGEYGVPVGSLTPRPVVFSGTDLFVVYKNDTGVVDVFASERDPVQLYPGATITLHLTLTWVDFETARGDARFATELLLGNDYRCPGGCRGSPAVAYIVPVTLCLIFAVGVASVITGVISRRPKVFSILIAQNHVYGWKFMKKYFLEAPRHPVAFSVLVGTGVQFSCYLVVMMFVGSASRVFTARESGGLVLLCSDTWLALIGPVVTGLVAAIVFNVLKNHTGRRDAGVVTHTAIVEVINLDEDTCDTHPRTVTADPESGQTESPPRLSVATRRDKLLIAVLSLLVYESVIGVTLELLRIIEAVNLRFVSVEFWGTETLHAIGTGVVHAVSFVVGVYVGMYYRPTKAYRPVGGSDMSGAAPLTTRGWLIHIAIVYVAALVCISPSILGFLRSSWNTDYNMIFFYTLVNSVLASSCIAVLVFIAVFRQLCMYNIHWHWFSFHIGGAGAAFAAVTLSLLFFVDSAIQSIGSAMFWINTAVMAAVMYISIGAVCFVVTYVTLVSFYEMNHVD